MHATVMSVMAVIPGKSVMPAMPTMRIIPMNPGMTVMLVMVLIPAMTVITFMKGPQPSMANDTTTVTTTMGMNRISPGFRYLTQCQNYDDFDAKAFWGNVSGMTTLRLGSAASNAGGKQHQHHIFNGL